MNAKTSMVDVDGLQFDLYHLIWIINLIWFESNDLIQKFQTVLYPF